MGERIASKIKQIRALSGWKNRFEAAEKIGCSEKALGNYERGERDPGIDFLARFANAAGVDFIELVRLRLEDAGEDPAVLEVRDAPGGYKVGDPHDVAALRSEIQQSGLPIEWALLLMQLASSGDLTTAGARDLIEFIQTEG